ncbi:MAG: peptidoglycan editing factor PgeF [Desulfuromonadaceae bacterium]|nr:peptidoglycan editing factor PgeF [Desulfuromonadaceae bacterium]
MKLAKQDKLNSLQASWANPPRLFAGVTTRNGGISRAPFNSLNLGIHTDDAPHSVEGNLTTFAHAFGIAQHHLLLVKQVHGCDIVVLEQKNYDVSHFQDVEADAIITNQPGLMLGITVADCYPILVFDPHQRVAAAIHAGWRGVVNGIIGDTIATMQNEFKSDPSTLQVAVGPGISKEHYIVGKEVRDAFRTSANSTHWREVAQEVELGQWRLDLRQSCVMQVHAAGIKPSNCDVSELCTYKNRDMLFSYRRDQGQTGRQMGYIMFR